MSLGVVTRAGAKPAEGAPTGARISIPAGAVPSVEAGILGAVREEIKKGLPETPEGLLEKKKTVLFGATKDKEDAGLIKLTNMSSSVTKGKELLRVNKETNKTVGDMLADLNLSKEQNKIALIGIEEFSSKSKGKATPSHYKMLFDYWGWLKERGVKIEDARRELTETYFDEKGIRENIYVHGANNRATNKPISLVESMNYEQCQTLVKKAEKQMCERFEYNAF